MAAMSAVPTATTITPPSSSHGTYLPWGASSPAKLEDPSKNKACHDDDVVPADGPSSPEDDHSTHFTNISSGLEGTSRKSRGGSNASSLRARGVDASYVAPSFARDARPRVVREINTPADSLAELYEDGKNESAAGPLPRAANDNTAEHPVEDSSKWIHRDKLAKIESEELQAAGIFLPRAARSQSRGQSRTRREPSQDLTTSRARSVTGSIDQTGLRSRKNSETPTEPHIRETSPIPGWDLRLPEEIAAEGEGYWVASGVTKGGSKIPVAKTSPLPIPSEHLERGTPMIRKRDASPSGEDSINYPKPRTRSGSAGNALEASSTPPATQPAKRSATEVSPKKDTPTPGTRKGSSSSRTAPNGSGRLRTRGGASKDSTSSGATTRPSTRSGERELSSSKQPEGDPPWLVSAYRPDPRLPPDQQLLPTVARRLQQEKWEKEGKFGNIYDKEFRPLNEKGLLKPPEAAAESAAADGAAAGESTAGEESKTGRDRPIKAEQTNPPPTPQLGRTGSYSTMPKVKNDRPNVSPIPGARMPVQPQTTTTIKAQAPIEDESEKKGGCGCCIVM